MKGQACDFQPLTTDLKEVFNWMAFESNLDFDQLIFECDSWIHVSYRRDGKNRGQILRAYKVRRRYLRWKYKTVYEIVKKEL
jgi:hypothetical protein